MARRLWNEPRIHVFAVNIFQEIKAVFAVKSTFDEITKEAQMPIASGKPGWQTTEFYFNLATQAAVLFGTVKSFIPAQWAAIISTAGIAIYTIARTVAKAVSDIQTVKSGATTVTSTPVSTTVTTPAA